MRVLLLAGCSILLAAAPASGQSAGFRVGQWGVEAPLGSSSGTLLKFNDPAGAWVIGAGLIFQRSELTVGTGTSNTNETSFLSFRLGRRWYQRSSGELRPFSSLGLSGGIGTQSRWMAGLFGEFGVSYFLTDRVNLGTSALLNAEWSKSEPGGAGGAELKQTLISVVGPRVLVGFLF